VLTTDQVRLLRVDNVASMGAPGLAELGVEATPLESIVPDYLWRFRPGGQFGSRGAAARI
jgi:NADH dehydrogenase